MGTDHRAPFGRTTYVEGEYPQLLREAEVRITLAEEDLQRAEEKLKWSRVKDVLTVDLPSKKPCEHAWTLKIKLK